MRSNRQCWRKRWRHAVQEMRFVFLKLSGSVSRKKYFLEILESSDSIYIDFVVSLVDICLLRLFTIWGSGPIGPIFRSRFLVAHRPTWLIKPPLRLSKGQGSG